MVSSNQGEAQMVWVPRGVNPVNTWSTTLYEEGLRDIASVFKAYMESEVEAAFITCVYFSQSGALRAVAGACGGGVPIITNHPTATPTASPTVAGNSSSNSSSGGRRLLQTISSSSGLDLDKKFLLAKETVFTGTADKVGNSKQSNLGVTGTTFASATEVALWTSLYLPLGAKMVDTSTSILESKATMYDASCFSVVTNVQANKLVGQLVNDCVHVVAGNSFASIAELCMPPKDNVVISSSYPVKDFAVRAGTPGAYTYRPLGKAVSFQAGQYCASINANGWYCPITRTAGYASATADTGSYSCQALDALTARAQLQQQCTAGDSSACVKVGMPSPPPSTVVTQSVGFKHLSSSDWKGVTKTVYETAYGNLLGIYDLTLKRYQTGCGVGSAGNGRRTGITVTYTATVAPTFAVSATTASQSLQANPAAFINAVAQAKASIGAAANAVAAPSAADLTVYSPVITGGTAATTSSSGDDFPIGIGIAVVAAICLCGIAAAAYFGMSPGSGSRTYPKDAYSTDVEMQPGQIGVGNHRST